VLRRPHLDSASDREVVRRGTAHSTVWEPWPGNRNDWFSHPDYRKRHEANETSDPADALIERMKLNG